MHPGRVPGPVQGRTCGMTPGGSAAGHCWPGKAFACALFVSLLALSGCGSGEGEGGAGEPPVPSEAYSQIVERIAREGSTPELALQAFTLVFGDVPGAQAPETSDGPGLISGTGAAGIAMEHFDEFTPEQQRVIEEKLIPSDGDRGGDGDSEAGASTGVARLASVGAGRALVQREDRSIPRRQVPDPELTAQARGWARKIEAKVGRRFAKPIYVISGFESSEPAWALPVFAARPAAAVAGELGFVTAWNANRGHDACLISVSNLVTGDPDDLGRAIDEILAHEVIHCLEFEIAGWPVLSRWVAEGTASWAGLALAGDRSARSARARAVRARGWRNYLEQPRDLFWRAHDAIGFFAQADEWLDGGLWDRMASILAASDDSEAFDRALPEPQTEDLARWAPAHARRPEFGRDWRLELPAEFQLPADVRAEVEEIDLGGPGNRGRLARGASVRRNPGARAPALYEFKLPQDPTIAELTLTVKGHGRLLWLVPGEDEVEQEIRGRFEEQYCLLDDTAECGGATPPADEVVVAVAGTEPDTSVRFSEPRGYAVPEVAIAREMGRQGIPFVWPCPQARPEGQVQDPGWGTDSHCLATGIRTPRRGAAGHIAFIGHINEFEGSRFAVLMAGPDRVPERIPVKRAGRRRGPWRVIEFFDFAGRGDALELLPRTWRPANEPSFPPAAWVTAVRAGAEVREVVRRPGDSGIPRELDPLEEEESEDGAAE